MVVASLIEEGLANSHLLPHDQLLLGLEVNVDSIPVLYCSYTLLLLFMFKISRVKVFRQFHCPQKFFY